MTDTLEADFAKCQQDFNKLDSEESLPASDPTFQQLVKDTLTGFVKIQVIVDRAGIFSSNEELDDINTSDLKYLLVPYFIGDLILKISDNNRLKHLQNAKNKFAVFLDKCDKLNVLGEYERDLLSRDTPMDSLKQRNDKIQRFKKQKAASAKLAEIIQRKQALQNRSSTAGAAADLEELEREIVKTQLEVFIQRTFDHLASITQESEILAFAATQQQQQQQQQYRRGEGSSNAVRPPPSQQPQAKPKFTTVLPGATSDGPLSVVEHESGAAAATYMKRFTERDRIKAEVFMHRNPHTISVEEFGEQEYRRMQELQRQHEQTCTDPTHDHDKRKQKQRARDVEENGEDWEDEPTEEEIDAKTYKDRSWDDWKDANPRGMGNMKKNM